ERARSADRDPGAEVVVDQVAVREAQVGLEGVDARSAEPVAQGGDVARQSDGDAADRLAGEIGEPGRLEGGPGGQRRAIALADEAVRPQAIVLDEERRAVVEASEELDDRPAGANAMRRLEQETRAKAVVRSGASARAHRGTRRRRGALRRSRNGPSCARPRHARTLRSLGCATLKTSAAAMIRAFMTNGARGVHE